MRKAHLFICPVLLLFCPPGFAQESSRGGSAKQDAPKVIETEDMKLAMKAGKLETAGKYDEALKVYAQAIDLKGRFTPFVYHNRGMLYLHRAKASQDRQSRIVDLQHAIDDF
jgi:tetratricopeptide (TPR) repeat protein